MTNKKTPSQEEVHRIMHPETSTHKKNWIIWGFVSILAILLIIFGAGYLYLHSATNQISNNHSQHDQAKLRKGRPMSVLVMGTDVGALGRNTSYAGNTDTMELLTINPTQGRTVITAIPRDLLVKINTKKGSLYEKINAAYAIGGPDLAKKQVSELLNVPVDYYSLINMGTLEKVVDAVGGVEVDNPFKFEFEGHKYVKGRQKLNGKQALGYTRMRYQDPDNDYGRQRRGQQVLENTIERFKNNGSVLVANKTLIAVKDGLRTDVPLDNLEVLYRNYASAMNSTQHEQLKGKDAKIDGTDFQIATPDTLNDISKQVRHSLGLKPIKIHNEETKMFNQQKTWNGYDKLDFTLPNGAKYNQLIK